MKIVGQKMDLNVAPASELPDWGQRVQFDSFFIDLCPAAPRALNVRLSNSLASISFSSDEGLSSLAGDRLRKFDRRPYEYVVVPPKFPIQGKSMSAPEVLVIVYSFDDLKREVAEALQVAEELLEPRVIIGGPKPFITEIAQRIRKNVLQDKKPSQYLRALCIVLIVEMMRLPPEQLRTGRGAALEDRVLEMVLDYIEANLDSELTLEVLASLAGVQDHKFARSFKKKTGETPHRFVTGRRILAAREMLESTSESIAKIAYATGFSSQSHMTTSFKREIGLTPAQIRN